jgi:4-carboxymuconolactone decarboxylase
LADEAPGVTRIPFADPNSLSAAGRAFLDGSSGGEIVSVMANAQDAFVPWFQAVTAIRASPDLDPVLRELVILRTAARLGCDYELKRHKPIALAAGVTPEQVDAVCDGAALPGSEGVIVSLVEDLFAGAGPGDERFAEALKLVSPRALVEAILIAGVYATVGRLIEAAALTP